MKDQIQWINEKANELLLALSQYKSLDYIKENVTPKTPTILNCISKKIKKEIPFLKFSIDPAWEPIGGWDISGFSEPFGGGSWEWFVINLDTKRIEQRNNDFLYFDFDFLIAETEDRFMKILLELAEYEYFAEMQYGNSINLNYAKNIYERRVFAEKYAGMAGGEGYYEYWSGFWVALTDQEIMDSDPIRYGLDLPATIKQVGDRYVWA